MVDQFYQDITDRNYPAAWALGGDNIGGTDYNAWVAGIRHHRLDLPVQLVRMGR